MTGRVHAQQRATDEQVRAQALQAAATVLAGRPGRAGTVRGVTLALAEEFARYIRTGSVELPDDSEEARL